MRTISVAIILLAAMLPASAQVTVTPSTIPIHISPSACPVLPGDLTGTANVTIVQENTTGHIKLIRAIHGTASAGDTKYILVHNDTITLNAPSSSKVVTFTDTEKFFLIGQDGATNVRGVATFHETIVNGTVVSNVDIERTVGPEGCLPPG